MTRASVGRLRKAIATGTRENREKRLVLLHANLELMEIDPKSVPETEEVNRVIKKMVLCKKSPEKAAAEIAALIVRSAK